MRKIIVVLALMSACIFTFAQKNSICGNWSGYLHIGNDSLKVVLVLQMVDDSVWACLDSPDQYVTDVPVDKVSFRNDTLKFSSKEIDIKFQGVMKEDSSIVGKFEQYGKRRSLKLYPHAQRKFFLRPQEPQPPYPYDVRELNFATVPPINGTLTMPLEQSPRAAIILITGSGYQDRDETIYRHKPFKLLADTLTRMGYAVYRYDDPAIAYMKNMTTLDFANQVKQIMDSLSQLSDLKDVKIGLLGHSEGGLVASICAAQNPNVAFMISLAGVAEPMKDVLTYQIRKLSVAENIPEEQIEKNIALSKHLYEIVEKSKKREQAQKQLLAYISSLTSKMTEEQKVASHLTPKEVFAIQQELLSPWFYEILHIEPSVYIKKIECPILALNGEKDSQVNAASNLPLFEKFAAKNTPCTTVSVAGVNHLFQECSTGLPGEYGEIEQTMKPEVLGKIVSWLKSALVW